MDSLIYSASPLKAFSGVIITITGLFLIGAFGAYTAIAPAKRKSQNFTRIISGCASIVLFLACIGVTIASYNSYKTGEKTVVVRLDEKIKSPVNAAREVIVRIMFLKQRMEPSITSLT